MTGAIYVRYSPRIEQDQSFTLENQISMCRELAVKDGVLIDENHIYQDHKMLTLEKKFPSQRNHLALNSNQQPQQVQ